jgi:epsilon-lactone hydrolase
MTASGERGSFDWCGGHLKRHIGGGVVHLALATGAAIMIAGGNANAQTTAAPPAPSSPAVTLAPASVAVPAYILPPSSFNSPEAITLNERQSHKPQMPPIKSLQDLRAFNDGRKEEVYQRARAIYDVKIEDGSLGGVSVQRVTPAKGVSPENKKRVLISLHGGGFLWGAGKSALLESIPIAAIGQIEVITVDYRMAPEHSFPAASEDVAAVYKALLAKYSSDSIGIYGCSAGGFLTAQSVAWFLDKKLPVPGAIGTFCASVVDFGGDSMSVAAPLRPGNPAATLKMIETPYFTGAKANDPLAFPGVSPSILSRFPPTLLITSTRDYAMSSVIHSNELLTDAGVKTELHVWDGLPHAFFSDPELPESKQVYQRIVSFFDRHLKGRRSR